jgi:hypothetical protein
LKEDEEMTVVVRDLDLDLNKVYLYNAVLCCCIGYLDPSLGRPDLPAGTELELPLWAVKSLARKGYVSVRVPVKYREGYRYERSLIN